MKRIILLSVLATVAIGCRAQVPPVTAYTCPATNGTAYTALTTQVTSANVIDGGNIIWNADSSIHSTAGYVPSASGRLTLTVYSSAGYINVDQCNDTGASITPGSLSVDWMAIG